MKTYARVAPSCAVAVLVTLFALPVGAQDTPPALWQTPRTTPASTASVPMVPSFGHLFEATIGDLGKLPSRDTLTWLSIGAVAALATHRADTRVTRTLSTSQDLHDALGPGAVIGGAPLQLGAALATYAVGRMTSSPRTASLGADLFRAQALAQATTFAVKYSVRRARPDDTKYSFPSGHTSTTFATATVLQRHFGWKAGIPAYAVASYVAASRVQMKRHYLSDVAFGAALGIVAGRTVTVGRGDGRFALGPIAAPSGAGVGFTWLGKK